MSLVGSSLLILLSVGGEPRDDLPLVRTWDEAAALTPALEKRVQKAFSDAAKGHDKIGKKYEKAEDAPRELKAALKAFACLY